MYHLSEETHKYKNLLFLSYVGAGAAGRGAETKVEGCFPTTKLKHFSTLPHVKSKDFLRSQLLKIICDFYEIINLAFNFYMHYHCLINLLSTLPKQTICNFSCEKNQEEAKDEGKFETLGNPN